MRMCKIPKQNKEIVQIFIANGMKHWEWAYLTRHSTFPGRRPRGTIATSSSISGMFNSVRQRKIQMHFFYACQFLTGRVSHKLQDRGQKRPLWPAVQGICERCTQASWRAVSRADAPRINPRYDFRSPWGNTGGGVLIGLSKERWDSWNGCSSTKSLLRSWKRGTYRGTWKNESIQILDSFYIDLLKLERSNRQQESIYGQRKAD